MFDKTIRRIRHYFGITTLADWNDVQPGWILGLDGVGPATLDHIRLYLAAKNTTLAGDKTPEFWNDRLAETRIAKSLSEEDVNIVAPFTILVDSREQQPFGFENIRPDQTEIPADIKQAIIEGDIEREDVRFLIQKEFKHLGDGMGDYSIDGFEGRAHIERKSMEDAQGTILGWGRRRERFEIELTNLQELECKAVVVECSLGDLLANAPCHGKRSASDNRKSLYREYLAWSQDFDVPWYFCESREFAELTTFRLLNRFWKKQTITKPMARLKSSEALQETLATL